MTGTTHALVGAAIGRLLGRTGPALVAGVVSHGVLDVLPHQDYTHARRGLLLDGLGVLAALSVAWRSGGSQAVVGALGGMLPDLEHARGGGNPHPPTKLFPSHWIPHDRGIRGFNVATELCVAVTAFVVLIAAGRQRDR